MDQATPTNPLIEWAQRLQAMSQNGLTYASDEYDLERYRALRQIAAEMLAAASSADLAGLRAAFDEEVGHATPKVDVRGVVFRGDTILLVKERKDGKWTLPGGWADVGEPPSRATVREVYEESGYETRPVRLLALYDRNSPRHGHTPHPFHIYKVFFLCEITGGSPTPSNETEDVAFFEEKSIPALSLGRVTPSQIARFYQYHRHPDLPADFD